MTPRMSATLPTVVVTGVGLALPGADTPRQLLRAAPSRPYEPFEPFDTGARIGRRGHRYKDRATRLALCAALDALRDAALIPGDSEELTVPGGTVGVVASSNLGNLDTACLTAAAIAKESTAALSPMGLPNASSNVIASWAAIRFGLRGPNLMLCNGATSGLDAVHWAATLVTSGRVRRALVIGVETCNPVVEGLLNSPAGDPAGEAPGGPAGEAPGGPGGEAPGGPGGEPLLDGAAALVVEGAAWARDRGAEPVAALGRYERRAGLAECVRALLPEDRAPGVWFTPGTSPGPRAAGAGMLPGTVPRYDLTAAFGRASGALGVLQCAAAVGWLGEAGAGAGDALVTSGDDPADAVAALLLRPPGRPAAGPRQPGGAAA
ncbi:hypothetical protein GCM10010246_70680 [Streptomyces cuspidosporus]|uniref:Beta-ketoacyl synthase-like N-terminal domain-containing protein n=2 Tax=Streptomyces cuspidosporus TaxID=66882 RepID=A0ABN3H3M7_9ACTN